MGEGRRRQEFPEAFKREAVKRVRASGMTIIAVADELGLHETVLRCWIQRYGEPGTAPRRAVAPTAMPGRSPADLAAKNARLKRKLERARMERDILKEAKAVTARRARRGLLRHDLRGDRRRRAGPPQGFPPKVAAEVPGRGRQPGGGRRPALHLHPPASGQWRSARTTNAIERLHEEFRRRIKTQTVLPEAETAPMLFWALLAFGQITMRKVDGWESLSAPLADQATDLAA